MSNRQLVGSNRFNGHRFEKYSKAEETAGVYLAFAIDGIEVSKEEWTRQREAAIARDLAHIRRSAKE